MGYFGSNYANIRPTKYRWHNLVNRGKFNSQQYNNAIFNIAIDEILLHANQ